jgi:hypothetical protein
MPLCGGTATPADVHLLADIVAVDGSASNLAIFAAIRRASSRVSSLAGAKLFLFTVL